jgi:type VI secretion system protein ImpH
MEADPVAAAPGAARAGPSPAALPAAVRWLGSEPFRVEFFQAVRLLERAFPDRLPVGTEAPPDTEAVHFAASAATGFMASAIQALEPRTGAPPRMLVNFMGLTGPSGVLPLHYTLQLAALIAARRRLPPARRDDPLCDYFDIFNHRFISLLYRAWEGHHFAVAFERDRRDPLTRCSLGLLGLGDETLRDRLALPDDDLASYVGLLGPQTRSAVALETMVADYFGVPVEITQFVGAAFPLTAGPLCRLGDRGDNARLGCASVLGGEVWDVQHRARITLGPLDRARYEEFLPGGVAHARLRDLVRFFAGGLVDFELHLVMERAEVPPCLLNGNARGPRLAWTSWLGSWQLPADAQGARLNLWEASQPV